MSNKQLIIFGNGQIAELSFFYFSKFTDNKIAGFMVDEENIKESKFCNLPLFSSAEINKFPTDKYKIFVALSYKNLNAIRKEKYIFFKSKNYELASYVSEKATNLSNNIIGDNLLILENNVIQPYAKILNNVFIWSGNHIGHHSVIKDHVFISSHVVISGNVTINENCFLGVNSTIRDSITIGEKSIIGASSTILKNVEKFSVIRTKSTLASNIKSDKISKI